MRCVLTGLRLVWILILRLHSMLKEPPLLAEVGMSVADTDNDLSILAMHLGPLPDPQTLREYDILIPGVAAEIIKTASDQALHRRNLEKAAQDADSLARDKQIEIERERIRGALFTEQLGVVLGWLIAASCVGSAIWSMLTDKNPILTIVFLGLPIAGIINAIRK